MTNKIISSLKIVTLAVVLSFGLSYVYAWTAPTQSPPSGNVSAPINTSATAQTKVGDLKVSGNIGIGLGASSPAQKLDVAGSAQITGTIWGGGAQTNYGATTIRGGKNGWSGINFAESSGVNNGTLMMHPSYSGFYNATDNGWRWYVTNAGASVQSGSASASDFCTTGGKCLSTAGGSGSTNVYTCPAYSSNVTYCENKVTTCTGGLSLNSSCVYWWYAPGGTGSCKTSTVACTYAGKLVP